MAVNVPSIVQRLAALPALADIPREQLEWLVEHGEVHRFGDGQALRGDSLSPFGLMILISGRFSVRVDQGGMEREVREVTAGRITGYLPYSRMTKPRGYLVADGPVEFLQIRQEDLKDMTRACYEFTAACVQEMLARVRVFKSEDKDQEKMAALGRLSAGLAHELNNPASAVARAAGDLNASGAELAAASRALGAAGLGAETRETLEDLEAASRRPTDRLSPVERADLEDRLQEWLEVRGVDAALAFPLAESGVALPDLESAAAVLDDAQLPAVLRYVAADATFRGLTGRVSSSAARIHSLVAAVEKHTHMDRAPGVELIALEDHLSDTVALMSAKASVKGVALSLRVGPDLPRVPGSVADLNQVWMHLVDNAIEAAAESVRISVDPDRGNGVVVVRVVDDGPGIPEADRERVFEPFFTTRDVGQGRGLGLDVVRTVVRSHKGVVELSSRPGRTEFRVTLPAAEPVAGDGDEAPGAPLSDPAA